MTGHRPSPSLLGEAFDLDALEASESTFVLLDASCTIMWVNPAWSRFALANGGSDALARVGPPSCYLDGISGCLRVFYESKFADALRTGEAFEQDYLCCSRRETRTFHMRALPLGGRSILVEHGLLVEGPHVCEASAEVESTYVSARGLVVQCSNCRRVRRVRNRLTWDWVPAWVERPPRTTSHGLCAACVGFYFP